MRLISAVKRKVHPVQKLIMPRELSVWGTGFDAKRTSHVVIDGFKKKGSLFGTHLGFKERPGWALPKVHVTHKWSPKRKSYSRLKKAMQKKFYPWQLQLAEDKRKGIIHH